MSDSFENIIADSRCTSCIYAYRRGNGPVNCVTCRVAAGIGSEHGDGAGGSVNIGEVATFPGAKADKAQALKVLEEAAEVFGAWQEFDDGEKPALSRWRVLVECADVIQATCNLLSGMGVADFTPYVAMCRTRNEERGRFDG